VTARFRNRGESGLALLGSLLLVSTLAVLSTAFLLIMAADIRIGMSHHQSTQLQYTIESAIEIASYELALDPTIAIPADSTVPILVDSVGLADPVGIGMFEVYSYPDSLGSPHIRQLRMRASTARAWSDLFWEALIPTQDPRAYFAVSAGRSLYIAAGSTISGGNGVLVSRDATLALNDSVGALVVTPPFSDYQPEILLSDAWPYPYQISGDPTVYQAQVIPQDKFLSYSGPVVQTRVSSGLSDVRGLALNMVAGKMYWSDRGTNSIRRSNLDGSFMQILFGVTDPRGLAIDVTTGRVYFTDNGGERIRRCNPDGTNRVTLVPGLPNVRDVALDLRHGKMYWTEGDWDRVMRANLDGSGVENVVVGLSDPRAVAVDPKREQVYWSDNGTGLLQRARVDGTDVETIISGIGECHGVEVDPDVGKIYWTDNTSNRIYRADLDGSNIEPLVTAGLATPYPITVDFNGDFAAGTSDRIYWADAGTDRIQRMRVNTLTLRPNEATNPMGIFVWTSATTGYYWSQSPYWYYLGIDGTLYCPSQSGLFVSYDIGFRVSPRVHDGPGGPERYPAVVSKGDFYIWLGIRDVLDGYVYVNDWFYNNATDTEMTINGALAGGNIYCLSPVTVNYDTTLVTQQSGPLNDPSAIYPTILLKRRRFYVLPYGGS